MGPWLEGREWWAVVEKDVPGFARTPARGATTRKALVVRLGQLASPLLPLWLWGLVRA